MSQSVAIPLTNPHTGSDFLASTNFKVAQDMSVLEESMKSVFKKDYPPYQHYGREKESERPKLAEVMTRDDTFFKDRASETVHAFEYRYLPKPVALDDIHQKLRSTNFKMDTDVNKVNVFETMHTSYFKPKMTSAYQRTEPAASTSVSHIPQGDPDKALEPCSDYRDRFMGHDTSVHVTHRAPSMHEGGPPTVKGDDRMTNFKTSHGDQFQGKWEKPVQTLPAPYGYNIPVGDPDKVTINATTMQDTYPFLSDKSETKPYCKSAVSAYLGRTNFKERDGHGRYNDYLSTASVSFQPASTQFERYRPGKHRNHSDFPEGDLQESRVAERVNMTTSRFYHGNPPLGLHNRIVSGANLRTKSNVQFEEPPLTKTFYDTTTHSTFKPANVPYTYDRTKFHKETNIPMDYYDKNEVKPTSSFMDFKDPRIGRMNMHNPALENLKMSHILPPLGGSQLHNTTHQVMFTPKSSEKHVYDSQRLQKSSVPLGTLKIV